MIKRRTYGTSCVANTRCPRCEASVTYYCRYTGMWAWLNLFKIHALHAGAGAQPSGTRAGMGT